ncbi:UDP-Glycosyltransferase superfamily protein [Rhynchospora pubera]|uniref:UDP-Glycosyltransferase superfamily protein n=1 Tax=Rhynchospora pubera TaxID=906938 RepID=A0AAV8DIA8_9POAL|nr:UDP-Glycosyltransferase superfamily protein [Rhynchospora pubera]
MVGSIPSEKPHAVCIPYPAQGHITPMLKLAQLLHSCHGFHITFVNTHYNHRRLLNSGAISSHLNVPDFRFESIPDGLPAPPEGFEDATQDVIELCRSVEKNCLKPFIDLLGRVNNGVCGSPPVSFIVSDGIMSFTLDAAQEMGLKEIILWCTSACGYCGFLHYKELIQRGIVPLKDEAQLKDGYLEMPLDWIPGLKNMRLRDMPSFLRTTDPNDFMMNFANRECWRNTKASAIVLNTFDELEQTVLDTLQTMLPPVYTVGPLSLLSWKATKLPISSTLWKEDTDCLKWLDSKKPGSVVYVNFGSITVMTNDQLIEFAWGLANSKCDFLWVIRNDLVKGNSTVLPPEFSADIEGQGLLASWCQQEAVLAHPAIGGFLTHSGWNSTIECLSCGVPMISWPFFADQQTNCRYVCTEWGVGMEIDNNVKRDEVEWQVRELMTGGRGAEMRNRAVEWKKSAIRATQPGGSSFVNLGRLVNEVMLPK